MRADGAQFEARQCHVRLAKKEFFTELAGVPQSHRRREIYG